ncbi:PREDICTED: transcription factor bHLH18-like [Ipomoea nil]|uniref:transcription factor bHLH18-like n=1 Tax=Ipomoea nil TaxID=35883 RepID=UPI00090141FA|nr:PREDICTED: transcription factor bHLH18-like [Ipomoea nil]
MMNLSQACFSGMGMDDLSFLDQFQILQSIEQELAAVLGEDVLCSSSPEEGSPPPPPPPAATTSHLGEDDRPSKQLKNHHHPNLDVNPTEQRQELVTSNASAEQETVPPAETTTKKGGKSGRRGRPPTNTYDHIMAERKRRELLSRQFLALSTIVPGLRKMDKTSVLGDTIKYLKQIQERVRLLEEESSKRSMESIMFVNKYQESFDDNDDMSSGKNEKSEEQPRLEIETRLCDNHILLRIHCERHKGVIGQIFSEVEKLNLAVVNSSVARFGSLTYDITIIVEMLKEFDLPVKHIAKNLRYAIQNASKHHELK